MQQQLSQGTLPIYNKPGARETTGTKGACVCEFVSLYLVAFSLVWFGLVEFRLFLFSLVWCGQVCFG